MCKNVVVAYEKEYLEGLSTGQRYSEYVVCNSRKSANDLVRELRANKNWYRGGFSGDAFRVRKIRKEAFTKALNHNFTVH